MQMYAFKRRFGRIQKDYSNLIDLNKIDNDLNLNRNVSNIENSIGSSVYERIFREFIFTYLIELFFAVTPMVVSTVGLTQEGASAPSTSTSQTVVGIEKKHSDAVVNFILRMTCQVHLCSSTHIFFRLKYNALIKLSKVPSINCRVGFLQRFELCLFLCKFKFILEAKI